MTIYTSVSGAVSAVDRKATKLRHEVAAIPVRTANEVGLLFKGSVAGFLGGNSIVLSGVGKNGAKVGVRYDIKGKQNPTVAVFMTGPAHFVERDTEKHDVPRTTGSRRVRLESGRLSSKRESTGRATSAKRQRVPMFIPGVGWRTGPFRRTGGSKGRHVFERGVERAEPLAVELYRKRIGGALGRAAR